MSITIKEIAILAQTSRGTVDRVVNNRGGVSEKLEDLKTGLKFTYTHYIKKEKEND